MKLPDSWRFRLLEALDPSEDEKLEYVFLLLRQRDSSNELKRLQRQRLKFELCGSDETDLEATFLRDELEFFLLGYLSSRSWCCEFSWFGLSEPSRLVAQWRVKLNFFQQLSSKASDRKMSDSGINRLLGSQVACSVVFVTTVGWYCIIFSSGNNYYSDNSILRTTVMDCIDTGINYTFRPEETVGMLMGNKLWAL